jgi:hypothetical protein
VRSGSLNRIRIWDHQQNSCKMVDCSVTLTCKLDDDLSRTSYSAQIITFDGNAISVLPYIVWYLRRLRSCTNVRITYTCTLKPYVCVSYLPHSGHNTSGTTCLTTNSARLVYSVPPSECTPLLDELRPCSGFVNMLAYMFFVPRCLTVAYPPAF